MSNGTTLSLGTHADLAAHESQILSALREQRRRLVAVAGDLGEHEWRAATRCSAWEVHDVFLHVRGATEVSRAVLDGERASVAERFDPRTTPNLFVEAHRDEAPADTVQRLDGACGSLFAVTDRLAAQDSSTRVTAVWGRPVDWRLFAAHLFWDAWLHERDVLLPLGRTQATTDAEARLAVAYGLVVAGVAAGLGGFAGAGDLCLGGTGGGLYRLAVDGDDVRVEVTTDTRATGAVHGSTFEVADALAGRGPTLGDVLGASRELVEALSLLGSFLASAPE